MTVARYEKRYFLTMYPQLLFMKNLWYRFVMKWSKPFSSSTQKEKQRAETQQKVVINVSL